MFEFIRTHQRLMQFLLFIFVAPFLFVGQNLLSTFSASDDTVAKVGGKVITQGDLETEVRAAGPRFAISPDARKVTLDRMIGELAEGVEASKDYIYPTELDVQSAIAPNIPNFEKLNKDERNKAFEALAMQVQMSTAAIKAKIRNNLLTQRLEGEIARTVIVPNAVTASIANYIGQQREVQQFPFKTSDFVAQVKVTDDMAKAYYNKNLALYQNPEQTKIEYVVLSTDALAKQITVSDSDVEQYYKDNVQKLFTSEEQRTVSHILVGTKGKDADAAKAKAEKLLAEVRKNPADFAKLAKENSDDPGSAEQGGSLGTDVYGKGHMVKPFEDAVLKMKVGEISDLVKSDYGYHIITVTAIKPAEVKPLAAVRDEIVAAKQKELAKKKFGDLREIFKNTVFEQSDSLKPVVDKLADKVKLTIETASVGRKPSPDAAQTAAYNNPKFLDAIFVDDVLKNKHNTNDIQIADGVVVSGRVTQYQAASQKPFEEVQAQVRDAVTQVEAHNLAQKAAEAKLAALNVKDDLTGFDAAKTISRKDPAGIDGGVFQKLLSADATTKLPAFVQVEVPGQGYSIYRINKVIPPAEQDPAAKSQIAQGAGVLEAKVYVEQLKVKSKAKILHPNLLTAPIQLPQPGTGDE